MFLLKGKVIEGLGKGKKLGFPTLNLDPECAPAKMAHGVYIAKISTNSGDFKGVLHYGARHVHDGKLSLEMHCFGLDKNLYGTSVTIEIGKKLRDICAFKNEAELYEQIVKDVVNVKERLAKDGCGTFSLNIF